MIIYKCHECGKSFLNGVDLSYHIEGYHHIIDSVEDKKCPHCSNEKIVFIAKTFDSGREKYNIYYCPPCKKALKIEQI